MNKPASRWISLSCTDASCGATWRASRKQIDRGLRNGGPWCMVCRSRAVEGKAAGKSKAERQAELDKMQREADAALEAHNAEVAIRNAAILERKRGHALSLAMGGHDE